MSRYYLICDNSVQWFSYIVCCAETQGPDLEGTLVNTAHDIEKLPYSSVIGEIFYREAHFQNRFFQGSGIQRGTYYGWTISEKEFKNLERACQLLPVYNEFNSILKLK